MHNDTTPTELEEETTVPIPRQTNRELVYGRPNPDFAEDDRWGDSNDPMDHGETEAHWRWLNGPMLMLLALLLGVAACGDEPPPDTAAGAVTATACDPYRVGGNKKCGPQDEPVAFVECATYPYAPDGTYQGNNPVEGCTLDFLARPGVPYTATCVAVCP